MGKRCKLPQRGPGRSPGRKHILMHLHLAERISWQSILNNFGGGFEPVCPSPLTRPCGWRCKFLQGSPGRKPAPKHIVMQVKVLEAHLVRHIPNISGNLNEQFATRKLPSLLFFLFFPTFSKKHPASTCHWSGLTPLVNTMHEPPAIYWIKPTVCDLSLNLTRNLS